MAFPTRQTSEQVLDQFNTAMRNAPWYQTARQRMGPGDLSRSEQSELEALMRMQGMPVGDGMHIDAGGNVNQKNRLGRNAGIAAGIAAGGYFAAPALMGALGASAPATAAGGLLPSTTVTGMGILPASISPGSAFANMLAGTSAAASGGGGGLMAALGGKAGMLGAGSRMLGAFGQSEAANRGTNLGATQNQDAMRLQGAAFDRAGQADALRKLASTDYILSGGRPYEAPDGSGAGWGPTAPSEARKRVAQQIQDEILQRTAPSGGFQFSDTQRYMRPSRGERFANILGPAAGIASQYFGQ